MRMFSKSITNCNEQGWWHGSLTIRMYELGLKEAEQKKKACMDFSQVNLLSKRYCNGITLLHFWNIWGSDVINTVQCNLFKIFNLLVSLLKDHNKFHESIHGAVDLCTSWCEIMKIVRNAPLRPCTRMLTTANQTVWYQILHVTTLIFLKNQ